MSLCFERTIYDDSLKSVDNLRSLLEEDDFDVLKMCLEIVDGILPENWQEFYEQIQRIESLSENDTFPFKTLAASITSKLHFYAGVLDRAMHYALLSESHFNIYHDSEYTKGVTYKCLDTYIEYQRQRFENSPTSFSPVLEEIVSQIVDDNIRSKNYLYVVGLAIEMRDVMILERAVLSSERDPKLLAYCVDCVNHVCDNFLFRQEVLHRLLSIYSSQQSHSLIDVARYLFLLDDKEQIGDLLKRLINPDSPCSDDLPVALQICFDLFENCPQHYLMSIISDLQAEASIKTAQLISTGVIEIPQEEGDEIFTTSGENYKNLPYLLNLTKMVSILEGHEPNRLQLDFLVKSLRYDLQTLVTMQESARTSTSHTATSICNALVHLGTACDTLMRTNIEWLSRSVGWGRFMMVASLGLIHKGHGDTVLKILQPYLPNTAKSSPSFYQEGGALYATGLAYAKCGNTAVKHFFPHLTETTNNVVLHGACLGVGIAALGSCRRDLRKVLKNILNKDDAISGEASALAIGLVMVGSEDILLYEDLMLIMMKTSHEKIQRGLSLALPMLFASRTKTADRYIEELLSSHVPIIRLTGIYVIAMAYAGTNDPYAIKRIWQFAVSDTNDDVKRACMIAFAIVMFRVPEQFIGIALLFVSSWNQFLKSGALLGIGMVFAGTGQPSVITVLRSSFSDRSQIVRQAAYIACSMVLVQRNEKNCELYKEIFPLISGLCTDRHNDTVGKLGAYIGFGILDSGGRNQTLSFTTLDGYTSIPSIVGFLVFQQFWYWYPLVHFLELCFVPSSIILVDQDLNVPNLKFSCSSELSNYAYPVNVIAPKKESHDKIRLSQLSHSNKSRVKQRRNINFKESEGNSAIFRIKKSRISSANHGKSLVYTVTKSDDKANSSQRGILSNKQMEGQKDISQTSTTTQTSQSDNSKTQIKPLPTDSSIDQTPDAVHNLTNPCRAIRRQLPFMSISEECLPLETIKPVTHGGIIVCFKSVTSPEHSKDTQSKLVVDTETMPKDDQPEEA